MELKNHASKLVLSLMESKDGIEKFENISKMNIRNMVIFIRVCSARSFSSISAVLAK